MIINHSDDYNVFDKLAFNANLDGKRGPRGWVRAFLDNEKIYDGPNLIVAQGREFVAQKLFEAITTDAGSSRTNFYNHKVSHFSVGSGGATISGSDVTLTGPLIGDTHIYKPITLGDDLYLDEPSSYTDSSQSPIVNTYVNAVKPISTHGSVVLEPVSYEASPDFYTKIRCTCVIPAGEPSVLGSGDSVPISEAGLYFVNGSLADTNPNKVNLFAHICFPPKWKELESQLTIFWYILC